MGKTVGVVLALKDKCTPVVVKFAQKLGMTEEKAKALNAQLNRQSAIIDNQLVKGLKVGVGALAGVGTAVVAVMGKTLAFGDNIDKMSQKIGMSAKAYQEWDYIIGQNGGNVDGLQMGFKALSMQMDMARKGSKDSISTFRRLGVAIKDNTGKLRSQEDVFNDSVAALLRMKNPTEKAIAAQKLFGKAAIDMKPLLNQSAESIEDLRKEAHKLGLIMDDGAVSGAVKLGDTLDALKRSFGMVGMSLGVQLIPVVQQLADQLINNLPQIKAALTPAITAFAEAIGFACSHLDVIIPAVTALGSTLGALIIIPKIASFVLAFCNPVGLAVAGVSALVAAIGVARAKGIGFGQALKVVFDTISGGIGSVVKLVGAVTGLGNALGAKPKKVEVGGVEETTIPHHALGTSFTRGGLARVGEYGPELVSLPRGASVISANKTRAMTSGGSNIQVTLNVGGNVIGNREFMNELMRMMAIELRKVMPA